MTARALRATARRIQLLQAEADDSRPSCSGWSAAVAPWLLELPGVGPLSAAQVLVSWSHAGRLRSEAAFAALAGTNPIPASSGQVTRHRLNRGGDRQLNRALHTIALVRLRDDPETRAYCPPHRRRQEPPRRSSGACERVIARQLFRAAGALRPTWRRDPPGGLTAHSSLRLFPNDAALLRLAGALLIEQNDEWLIARRYLSQESLELVLDNEPTTKEATKLTPALPHPRRSSATPRHAT